MTEDELENIKQVYKQQLVMTVAKQGIPAVVAGCAMLELSIPLLCIGLPGDVVKDALEEAIEALEKSDALTNDKDYIVKTLHEVGNEVTSLSHGLDEAKTTLTKVQEDKDELP